MHVVQKRRDGADCKRNNGGTKISRRRKIRGMNTDLMLRAEIYSERMPTTCGLTRHSKGKC